MSNMTKRVLATGVVMGSLLCLALYPTTGPGPFRIGPLEGATGGPGGAPSDTIVSVGELASLLGPSGDLEAGKTELHRRADSAPPDQATWWLQLLATLDRLGPESAPAAVFAVGSVGEGGASVAVEGLLDHVVRAAEPARPALLLIGALLMEREDPMEAAALRTRVLEDHADSPEAPEVTLRHARWLVSIDARRMEGIELLEEFLIAHPEHPLVPEARRIFLQERSRTQGSAPRPGGRR